MNNAFKFWIVMLVVLLGILMMRPVFIFALSSSNSEQVEEQDSKASEQIIEESINIEGIKELIDKRLKEKEISVITAYEKTANSFNWVLAGIGFFLATLVIFTFGYGKYWFDQIKEQLKQVKEYRDEAKDLVKEMESDKKKVENAARAGKTEARNWPQEKTKI